MADAPSTSAAAPSHDESNREEKLSSVTKPAADVEMENLPAASQSPNPDEPVTNSSDTADKSESTAPIASEPAALSSANKDAATADSTAPKIENKDAAAPGKDEGLTIDPVDGHDESATDGPALEIMLLLISGARHPFRVDEKYLTKRNVSVTGKTEDGRMDPFSITVYTLKELILRDWRKEWDQAPREPSAIRLIHFGRLLEDRMPLSNYQFGTSSRNVIHMTIKPQDIIDEEEAAKKVKDSGSERTRSGCCVIL